MADAFHTLEPGTAFRDSWYLGAVAETATAILSGQLPRAVITQPPGTLKSTTWCVAFPAWGWIDFPQLRFLIGTHDMSNAGRDAGYCRKLVRSRWYQDGFRPGWGLAEDQDAKLFYQTTAGGHRLSVSTGGSTAGKKGHVLIVDDIHDAKKVYSKTQRDSDKEWFRLGFSDRMMNFRTGAIAFIGHRVHKEDLHGELIAEGWPELRLPEEWSESYRKTWPVQCEHNGKIIRTDPRTEEGEWLRPERFGPAEKAKRITEGGGEIQYQAKHQQDPKVRSGQMFDYYAANRVATYPVGTVAVRYWDTAASESESACNSSGVLIGRTPAGRYIVIDEERGKWNPEERNRRMRNCGLDDMRRPGLVFRRLYWEKGASDSGLERDQLLARALAGIPCAADRAKGSKMERAEPFSSQWAAGNVDVVEGEWTHGYLSRMAEFPYSSDKDTTDASSGGFNKLALGAECDGVMEAPPPTITEELPAGTFDRFGGTDPYA